jgi:hypothetical protein
MKKFIYTFYCLIITSFALQAQPPHEVMEDRIPEKMAQFIQNRMELNRMERKRFQPIFQRYQHEWREVLRENRMDRLLLKQHVLELQIRFRKDFGDAVGERRVMEIYDLQEEFIRLLRDIQRERRMGPPPPPRLERKGMRFH